MQSQFDVTSVPQQPITPRPGDAGNAEVADLLRQIVEIQRDQLAQIKHMVAAQDSMARWRALMARWREEFPNLPEGCKHALPILEKAYGSLVAALVEELQDQGEDALDTEFTLQDFLDRYGMRLGQLGNILNLVGPLAEAGSQNESS
jgi:hypothetical protein